MIKIIKNKGQDTPRPLRKCKYLLYTNDFGIGELYAKVRIKPILGYIIAKIRESMCP